MKLNSFSYTCIPYTNTDKHRTSHFWVHQSTGSPFLPPTKTGNCCNFFIINTVIIRFFLFNSDKIFARSINKYLYQWEAIFLKHVLLAILLHLLKYLGLKSAKLFDHAPTNDPNLESLVFIKLNQCRLYSSYYLAAIRIS